MLQIGDDVDCLLIPREVRLAGGVWRVISKPATKEVEFRERLIQFLEEEGRTLEDVARIIEKSTPHPPQPPKKPKEPRARSRVQQVATPPPRLVVGTYDSSNASDSEFSDFEATSVEGQGGPRPGRKARKMPVSYLGSKFLGSDLESEDDEGLVEAFLRRRERTPCAQPASCATLPGPMCEDSLSPQLSKGDRWQDYVSQVSWGKLRRPVKDSAPRSGPEVGEACQASLSSKRDGASEPSRSSQPGDPGSAGDGGVPERPSRRWRPRITWASFPRCRRKEEAASSAPRAEASAVQGPGAASGQGAEAASGQGTGAASGQGAEAASGQGPGAASGQGAEAASGQGPGAASGQGPGAASGQGAEAASGQGPGAASGQGAEAASGQGPGAASGQGAEAADRQRVEATAPRREEAGAQGAQAAQEAEASAGPAAAGTPAPGARALKQVKTVRFKTPGRFCWSRMRRRAFWHTPRLPALPKRVPRVSEARSLQVLRSEARAEVERGEQEAQL
ncbi:coiled-coil domain-containing protein 8 [Ctenodactylus gundi]